jgi:two-component system chemotaxis response regulator CheB
VKAHDIVVVGGSAGSLDPLRTLLAELPATLPAAIFVVVHRPAHSHSNLCEILARGSSLSVRDACDGEPLAHGSVYVAPADHHLVLKQDRMLLTQTPRENQFRPAVDVLFRTAAVCFGSRVIGVILSGALDDGTAGLSAIKRCGGVAIVQAPSDAAYTEMPASAIRNVSVEHIIPAREIAHMIRQVVEQPSGPEKEIPAELILEAQIAETGQTSIELHNRMGDLTPFTCTDCGGPLWKQRGDGLRYRCLTGHALSSRTLEAGLSENLEAAVWAAIRQFEQRANLQSALADQEEQRGRSRVSTSYRERAAEAHSHAAELRKLLHATANEPAELVE